MQQWSIPDDRKYNRDNLWLKLSGNVLQLGLSEYGQYTTGDILYLDLVKPGTKLTIGDSLGSIESGKWVGRLVSPVNGEVIESNPLTLTDPGVVNSDPYNEGWMLKIALAEPLSDDELMNAGEYGAWVASEEKREEDERMIS